MQRLPLPIYPSMKHHTEWLPFGLSASIFVILLTGCAAVPQPPTGIARGDYIATQAYATQLIAHEMDKYKVPGLSIALVDDQRVIWAQGFGFSDKEREILASADTLYRVASISKLFTDVAAMQLTEQGKLDIDKPVQTYLPSFSPQSRFKPVTPITLRQLMTHHSGLPRDQLKGFHTTTPQSLDEFTATLRSTFVVTPPDYTFSYSNLGLSLLGDVVQTIAAKPFAQHMHDAVLIPMGMRNASFNTQPADSPLMAKSYRGRETAPEMPLRDVPAAGLNASVNDLSRFMSMVFANGQAGTANETRILKPESVADMLRPQNTEVPLDFNFKVGLGWMLSTLGTSTLENAGPVAHHGGSIGGFRSHMYMLPEHKLGVVVLGNSSTAGSVVDHVATETLKLALEAKTGIKQPQPTQMAWANTPVPTDLLKQIAGDYTTKLGLVQVRVDGKKLHALLAGKTFDLRLRTDGLLGMDYTLLGLIHINLGELGKAGLALRNVNHRTVLVARIGKQEMLVGERLTPSANLGTWMKRLGTYEITNLENDPKVAKRIALVEDNGYLVLELTGIDAPGQTLRTVVSPISETEALVLGTLDGAGETIRSVLVEGEERLSYSGYIVRKK